MIFPKFSDYPKTDEGKSEYYKAYYAFRREIVLDYLGGVCEWCGATEDLEIDHVDPNSKSFSIKLKMALEKIFEELEKCQLLCKTCHKEKTLTETNFSKERNITHGGFYAWEKLRCDCEICLEARCAYQEIRNERRRIK